MTIALEDVRATARHYAAVLAEPEVALLARCLRQLGEARCAALLAETLAREAQGGCLRRDGRLLREAAALVARGEGDA